MHIYVILFVYYHLPNQLAKTSPWASFSIWAFKNMSSKNVNSAGNWQKIILENLFRENVLLIFFFDFDCLKEVVSAKKVGLKI
jgi:hypothetical protein